LDAEKHALVIGGGVAGLRAAWDIARRGLQVTLIEKTPFLGGRMAQLETMFPTGESAREALHKLIEDVVAHPLITIFTRAELVGMFGYVGNYQARILQHSRGVSDDIAEAAMEACQIEVPDAYNHDLTDRKVIYRAYSGCYPTTPAVDWENCPNGQLEVEIDNRKMKLEDKPKEFDLTFGAVVVATGFNLYEPHQGEYGYGELPEVISLPQFIRFLALHEDDNELSWNGHLMGAGKSKGSINPSRTGISTTTVRASAARRHSMRQMN